MADRAGGANTDPGRGLRNPERFAAFVDRAAQTWDAAHRGKQTRAPPHLAGAGFASTMPARSGAANATAALFGGAGSRPSHSVNPFLSGIFGLADRASGGTSDPGAVPRDPASVAAFVDRPAQAWDAALEGRPTRTLPHLVGAGFASTMPARGRAANATAASFGGAGSRPSYGGNPFLSGIFGLADRAGGGTSDPGVRYERAIQSSANALFGALTAPDGLYRRALRQSARALAAAKADLDAEMSLTFT